MLNSEGGILIWGAPKGQKIDGKKEKIFQGALSPVDELKEKDGLINTISDTINPLPVGIAVKILDNGSSQYVYVFEVQVSNYRPHQYKHIYYARLDGQTRPAPHYLVEALMKRITYPNIEAYLKITGWEEANGHHMIDIEIVVCNFSELRNEENVSLSIKARIIILFGGKYSPMKSSKYVIDLNRGATLTNYNTLIVEKEENMTMAEGQRKLGKGREDFLKTYLGR